MDKKNNLGVKRVLSGSNLTLSSSATDKLWPNHYTTSNILALRRVIERVKRIHLKGVIMFVDSRKAFVSVSWGMMLKIQAYGIPHQLLQANSKLYEDTLSDLT